MNFTKLRLAATALATGIVALPAVANAGLVFTFTEVGGDVVMTSSGSFDTTGLVSSAVGGWGGVGIENNGAAGDIDIMGNTTGGFVDTAFAFNAGTDASEITNIGGPFDSSEFTWTVSGDNKSFATYTDFNSASQRNPGLSIMGSDLVGGVWSTDQTWLSVGVTLAALGLVNGTYTITDSVTGEFISIVVGMGGDPVPLPAALPLFAAGLGGIGLIRRRTKKSA